MPAHTLPPLGMGIVHEQANFHVGKTDFSWWEEKQIRGEKKSGYKKKQKKQQHKKKERWIPVKQLKRVHTWLVLVLVA